MKLLRHSLVRVGLLAAAVPAGVPAQTAATAPRSLPASLMGCDSSQVTPGDSVFEFDAVDQPVRPRRLQIEELPLRIGHGVRGHSTLRFIVERSGKIDRCSITLVEEVTPEWTDAVVKELRVAHYQPARRGGKTVRQRVYQLFTYYNDGRPYDSR